MTQETFQLVRERCLLTNINLRSERHGDEQEPAIDLAFEFSGANNLLLKLHPDLRASFYRADDNADIDADHMPHLRYPAIGEVAWDLEVPRVRLELFDELSPAAGVVLTGGKVNKFKLTMTDGGTVKWKFRAQFSQPDPDDIARLVHFQNKACPVSLECADEEDEGDNFAQAEAMGREPHSEARNAAEDLFKAPPTDMTLDGAFRESLESGEAVQG